MNNTTEEIIKEFQSRFKGDDSQLTYFGWGDEVEYNEVEQFIKEAISRVREETIKDLTKMPYITLGEKLDKFMLEEEKEA